MMGKLPLQVACQIGRREDRYGSQYLRKTYAEPTRFVACRSYSKKALRSAIFPTQDLRKTYAGKKGLEGRKGGGLPFLPSCLSNGRRKVIGRIKF